MKFLSVIYVFLFVFCSYASASHLRAGEITVEPVLENGICNPLKVRIKVVVYLDAHSKVSFGSGILSFGDSQDIIVPDQTGVLSSLDPETKIGTFVIEHTYETFGKYVISYSEPNRNSGIHNLDNSVQTQFYLEAFINLNKQFACNSSPDFLIPPIDKACSGLAFYHNPGTFDADGDSLSFELAAPKDESGNIAEGYLAPSSPIFYSNFNTGNENGDGPPIYSIDPISGMIIWNAPPATMETDKAFYNIAFVVKEWRKVNGEWITIGFIMRDMQIEVVADCKNNRPEISGTESICVEAGRIIDEDILADDINNDSVSVNIFSDIFSLENPPKIDSLSTNTFNFQWNTNCEHIRKSEYKVVFRVTDYPEDNGVSLTSYHTLRIKIIGPAPEIEDISKDGPKINISWQDYECNNATTIEVWRRVDSNSFKIDECSSGMPTYSGYKKLVSLPISQKSYVDSDLIIGAKYCYRVLVVFGDANRSESKVSEEHCYEFVPAEAPVITNVSVSESHYSTGEIDIKWMKPFDLDFSVYTGDIVYELYRKEGHTNDFQYVSTLVNDTTYNDQGLNTEDSIYYYKLYLKVPDILGNEIVDTSSIASSVRVEALGSAGQIDLSWNADVPWSNFIQGGYHLIYRAGAGTESIAEMKLIDSVMVTDVGFNYIDESNYQNIPIQNNKIYCYSILTRGSYGNPKIQSPLENFSQVYCTQPVDTIPPQAPVIAGQATDCENFNCEETDFKNVINWASPEAGLTYKIYYAPTTIDSFTYLVSTKDTFYIDTPVKNPLMDNYAGCYKIQAVDRFGLVSIESERYCFDNCPNYELPNVFTPDNNDDCNDLFGAFRTAEERPCGGSNPSRCARFIKSIKFKVYNRWGKEIYDYESGREASIYIDWDGTENNGKSLPSGIYYYTAHLVLDVVDPNQAVETINGWVQIMR